ncbi:MAG: Pseudogene of conserved hypothetical protein [Methanobrevibacter sp. CfCl-M3]
MIYLKILIEMKELLSFLELEKENKQTELLDIKIILSEYSNSEKRLKILCKHFVPAIYSIWEGFLKNSIREYSKYINRQDLKYDELGYDLLTTVVESKKLLNKRAYDFNSKKEEIKKLIKIFNDPKLEETKPEKSGLGYESFYKLNILRF